MKVAPLAKLILLAFVCVFISAAGYLLLDAVGVWPRLPDVLARAIAVVTGLILLFALVAHLVLATGALPHSASDGRPSS
jgi:hypothetical protein